MGSIFANRITDTISIDDSGSTITIRKLNPKALEAARKESQRRSLEEVKELGGPAAVRELQTLGDASKATDETPRRDPLLTHDALTLIEKGVLSWTYDEPIGREAFDELYEDARDKLATAILKLSKPSLYQTAEEQDAARVKG